MSSLPDDRLHSALARIDTALRILDGEIHEEARKGARIHLLCALGDVTAVIQARDLERLGEARTQPHLRAVK